MNIKSHVIIMSSSSSSSSNLPLLMFNPMSLVLFLTFYSPIVLTVSLLSVSFFHQNFKGIIFLLFLLGCCIMRYFIYMYTSKGVPNISGNQTLCNAIEFSKYGNGAFSVFVFGFMASYIFIPMFLNNSINFMVLFGLIMYCSADVFIKMTNNCIQSKSEALINLLAGLVSSGFIIGCMYMGGSSKYLFFNETQSNKEICNMPSKQTFKCQVYKNGELIG